MSSSLTPETAAVAAAFEFLHRFAGSLDGGGDAARSALAAAAEHFDLPFAEHRAALVTYLDGAVAVHLGDATGTWDGLALLVMGQQTIMTGGETS